METPAEKTGPAEVPEASIEKAPAAGAAAPFAALARAGVNVEMGLNYCGGDGDFYREMLQMFSSQSGEKREEIAALYEGAHWEDYTVKVHALKSTSLTIGAEALSAQAKALELAGKRGDTDFIAAHHAAMMEAYEALCAQLDAL